jgi:hypothetical protein
MEAASSHHIHLELATGLCPQPGKYGAKSALYVSKENFNFILSSDFKPFKMSLAFRYSYQNTS